ncbi:MAG TPA: hypothetical protein VFV38_08370 [Ktedonobacteraceae bacterium]|nr:hypothetical protein [Ktedonobacteraceae bacterium]
MSEFEDSEFRVSPVTSPLKSGDPITPLPEFWSASVTPSPIPRIKLPGDSDKPGLLTRELFGTELPDTEPFSIMETPTKPLSAVSSNMARRLEASSEYKDVTLPGISLFNAAVFNHIREHNGLPRLVLVSGTLLGAIIDDMRDIHEEVYRGWVPFHWRKNRTEYIRTIFEEWVPEHTVICEDRYT